jgi:hypothetical protein
MNPHIRNFLKAVCTADTLTQDLRLQALDLLLTDGGGIVNYELKRYVVALSDADYHRIYGLRKEDKIAAIKAIREITRLHLGECRVIIDTEAFWDRFVG